jgi:ribosomal protein S18 acetylase RimI-like enzyme
MGLTIRLCERQDFSALHILDQACFVPGISYSRRMLQYFLDLPAAECLVAEENQIIVGFVLAEADALLGHVITLDVAESHRRTGTGSALLREMERRLTRLGVESIVLETAVNNESGIAFWGHHGYRTEAIIKSYYLGRIDAFEMRKRLETQSGVSS